MQKWYHVDSGPQRRCGSFGVQILAWAHDPLFSASVCHLLKMGETVPAVRSCRGQVHSGRGSSNSNALIAHCVMKGPCVPGARCFIIPQFRVARVA